jgi:hypothetical protein
MAGPVNYVEKGFGLHLAVRAAGRVLLQENGVWIADDPVAVQAIIDAFDPMTYLRADPRDGKLKRLQDAFDARTSLFAIADGGTVQTVTAAQFGNFCASAINVYRAKKAAIQAATNAAELNAVDLTTGWPGNP